MVNFKVNLIFIKVCRLRRKTFLTTSEDLSVFVLFLIFTLQQIFSNGFSVISQPISIKFGMLIVLDETNSKNIFSTQ